MGYTQEQLRAFDSLHRTWCDAYFMNMLYDTVTEHSIVVAVYRKDPRQSSIWELDSDGKTLDRVSESGWTLAYNAIETIKKILA